MKKRLLSVLLTTVFVLTTVVVPQFVSAAIANYEFKMSEATIPSADTFAITDGWLAVRTKAGTGNSSSGDAVRNVVDITRGADEALTVTTYFMTGAKPTLTKQSFSIRLNLRSAPSVSSEWFHPFRVYADSSLDKPKIEFASNKDSSTFVATPLDTDTGISLEYNTQYILKTVIAPNDLGNAYFSAELYTARDGEIDEEVGRGEINNLVFDSSYACQFGGLYVCDTLSIMSLNHTSAVNVEEPVAYVNYVNFDCGVYEKEQIPKEAGTAEFYEASLAEPKTLIDDVITEKQTAFLKNNSQYDQYAYITDADALAGIKWYTNDNGSASEKTFLAEDGWLTVRPFQQAGNQNYRYVQFNRACPKFVKCYTPVTDGSAFSVKSTIVPYKSTLPKDLGGGVTSSMPVGFNIQLRLTNDEWNNLSERSGDSTNVFNIFSYGINQEERSLAAVAGVNQTAVNVGAVNDASSNFAAKTVLSYDIPLHGKEIEVEAKFVPNGDNYYVTVTCTDKEGNVLLTNSTPVVLSKETVADYNRFQISATYDDCVEMTETQSAMRYFKIKDVSIATSAADNYLKEGENKIYIPFKKLSGDYFNASVVAAIYNGDEQETYVIKEVKECEEESGSVSLDITITDVENQCVRYFVFDSFETLEPICKVKTPIYVQK